MTIAHELLNILGVLLNWVERSGHIRADAAGDPDLEALLRAPKAARLKQVLQQRPKGSAQRHVTCVALSQRFPLKILNAWADEEPGSADAHLLLGVRQIQWAWSARGYGRGEGVSDARALRMMQRLELAMRSLQRSAELNPSDPTPWAFMLKAGVYGEGHPEAQREFLHQAVQRDPEHWAAHDYYLLGRCYKWHGSHSEMFDFARQTAQGASERSLLPLHVISAHMHRWVYYDRFDEDKEAAEAYLQRPDVRQETIEAYERCLGKYDYDYEEAFFARTLTSAWFWLLKDKPRLRREFEALGPNLISHHWAMTAGDLELSTAREWMSPQG